MRTHGAFGPNHLLPARLRGARGFTLLELLIVGALIALFAGLAMFGMQQFYVDSRRKTVYDETKQVGTAAGFARDDVAFFPRLDLLSQPLALVTGSTTINSTAVSIMQPNMDAYGYLGEDSAPASIVAKNWRGNYLGQSDSRIRLSQGSKGLVKMRIPVTAQYASVWNTKGISYDLAYWPCDTWGHPYVVYLVVADSSIANASTNPLGLRLINSPGENATFMTAVVSYGPNGVPGGVPNEYLTDSQQSQTNVNLARAWIETMKHARLYLVNNDSSEPVTRTDNEAAFTLRSVSANIAVAGFTSDFLNYLPESIVNQSITSTDTARPGIKDAGSDDIVWIF